MRVWCGCYGVERVNGFRKNYVDLVFSGAAGTAPDTGFIRADYYETLATGGALMDDLVKNDPLLGQPGYFLEPQVRSL